MSRQNKVNPGQYTQRGRLTQDDAARELKQQRSIGSQHTWQPVQKDQMPRPRLGAKDNEADRDADTTGDNDNDTEDAKPTTVKPKPASRVTKAAAPKNATKVKTAKPAANAKSARSAKPVAKRAAKTGRKAVLARNVGGGGSKPRPAAKRRKS